MKRCTDSMNIIKCNLNVDLFNINKETDKKIKQILSKIKFRTNYF